MHVFFHVAWLLWGQDVLAAIIPIVAKLAVTAVTALQLQLAPQQEYGGFAVHYDTVVEMTAEVEESVSCSHCGGRRLKNFWYVGVCF